MDAKQEMNGERHAPTPNGGREYLELWLSLARREWGSLVFIPADRDGSTAEVANALADVGQRLSYAPVTAITVSSLEYGSALALADLQQHLDRERRSRAPTVLTATAQGEVAPASRSASRASEPAPRAPAQDPLDATATDTEAPGAAEGPTNRTEALAVLPPARLIISVPPVVTEPLGLAAAEKADAVVLAVRLNRTRMGEVRRTIELVGRERVFGCIIVR